MAKGYKPNERNEFERAKRKTAIRLAQLQRAKSRRAKAKGMENSQFILAPPSR
jgi:hypothetical protein